MTKDGRSSSVSTTTAVQVALRIRPLTQRDRTQPRFANLNDDDCLKVTGNTVRVVPHNKLFTFDHIFGPTSQQHEIFSTLGENLVQKFIEGYNITVLAYGQTSSGKTFTMGTAQHNGRFDEAEEGIVPRAMSHLFEALQQQTCERPPSFLTSPMGGSNNLHQRPASPTSSVSSSTTSLSKGSRLRPRSRLSHVPTPTPTPSRSTRISSNQSLSSSPPASSSFKYTVKVSFVEIYNEELNDLLNDAPAGERPPITIREDTKGQIYWTGVKEVNVDSADDVLFYLEQGTKSRATGATDMNEKSSRSHAIFSVTLQQEKWSSSSSSNNVVTTRSESPSPMNMKRSSTRLPHDDGGCVITTSKFHFVDLAGSERLKRTAAEGDRRKEGININAGLHALGNVISALGDTSKRGSHVPYRDSKLTRLLQDSLGGNATTLMIACASPVEFNLSETLNTLQYANRARNIKNKSEKNQVEEWMTTDNLELLRTLIGKLKTEVQYLKSVKVSASGGTNGDPSTATVRGFDDDDDDDLGMDHMNFDHQDADQLVQEHRLIIADLQHQIEELDGEASVTRERNKVVEMELQRLRKLEQLRNKKEQENLDFEHLVEPVIEEYEKSVAKLESELSVSRAALTHANMGLDELQAKCDDLQRVLDHQQEAMADLQLRFSKVTEREQSNDSYIEELESKLEQSAHDSIRYQDTLNELRTKVAKLKENDESTEHYIQDLERRLAISEETHTRLSTALEQLERQRLEQDNIIIDLKKQVKTASENGLSQQRSILGELDSLNEKYAQLEKDRDQWKGQVQQQQQGDSHNSSTRNISHDNSNTNHALSTALQHNDSDDALDANNGSLKANRRSLADEKETSASYAALAAKEANERADDQASRVRVLETQLEKLGYEHKQTIKEMDSVLQRYHEALEHVDHLEHHSAIQPSLSANNPSLSSSSHNGDDDDDGDALTGTVTPTTTDTASVSATTKRPASIGCLLDQEMGRAQDQEFRHTIALLEHQVKTLSDKAATQQKDLASQQQEYTDHVKSLKATIQRLETEGDDAAQAIRSLEQLKDDNDDFMERTLLQLDEATEANESLLKQHSTTQAALKSLQHKHRSVVDERNELGKQLAALKLKHDSDQSEHASSSVAAAAMADKQLNSYQDQISQLEKTIHDRDQEHTTLLHDLTATRDQLEQLQAAHMEKMTAVVASAAQVQKDLETCVEQLQLEVERYQQQLKTHTEVAENGKAEMLARHDTHINDLTQSHNVEKEEWMRRLEQQQLDNDAHVDQLTQAHNNEKEEWKRHIEQQQTTKDELMRAHNTALADVTDSTKQLEASWSERQAEWSQRIQQLGDDLKKEKDDALAQLDATWLTKQTDWRQQRQQLEQEALETDKRHRATIQAHTDALVKEKTGMETDKAALTHRVTDLERALDTANDQLQQARTKLTEAENDIAEMEELLQTSDGQLDDMTARATEAENNISTLEGILADAVKENETLNEKLKDMESSSSSQRQLMEQQYQTLDHDYQALKKECQQAHDQVDRLQQQLLTSVQQHTPEPEKQDTRGIHQHQNVAAVPHATTDASTISSSSSSSSLSLPATTMDLETLYHQSEARLADALAKVAQLESHQQQQNDTLLADQKTRLDAMAQQSKEQVTQLESSHQDQLRQLQSTQQQILSDVENTHKTQLTVLRNDLQQQYDNDLTALQQKHSNELTAQQRQHDIELATLQQTHHDDISILEAQLSKLQQDHQSAIATLEQKHSKDITALEQKNNDTLTQLSSLQQTQQDTTASPKVLDTDDDSQHKQLQDALQRIDTLQNQLSSATTLNGDGKEKEWKRLMDENEEYAELTATLEQEMNKMTQDMDKLVIEVGDNEVTIHEQEAKIQQLTLASSTNADKAKADHQAEIATYQDQVQVLEQQQSAWLQKQTAWDQEKQKMQASWDQDKQQKDKLAKQVKLLEEKMDMLLQEKKKFLCF